jgi:putative holliday junction resolvase
MKLLALDYGDARIGVARSDDLGMLAHPVETVASQPRPAALARIAQLLSESQATALVVGLPMREDGSEGPAAVKVKRFVKSLESLLPQGFPVHYQDEYRTTEEAKQHLRAAGKREKNYRPVIDQAAAVVILQEYLDRTNGPSHLLLDEAEWD